MLQRVSTAALVLALCLGVGAQRSLDADMQRAITAIKNGNVEELKSLLKHRPALASAKDPEYRATLLHWAAARKDAEAVSLLIEHNAARDAQNKEGATPLQVAIVQQPSKPGGEDLLDLVKKLATRAVVKMANADGKTALHLACQFNQLEIARFLISDMGADVNARTKAGKEPLDYAPEANPALGELLRTEKARLNPPPPPPANPDSSTVLQAAAVDGDLEALRRILSKNRQWINAVNEHGETPLHLAAKNRRLEVVAELIKEGANVKLKDKQGRTFWDFLCQPPAR